MKHLLLASLITLLAIGTACGQASGPEPVANDGIQVHGHWTVTVTNPDGTVDAVHEFENVLGGRGSDLLTLLLSDQNPGPLTWHIIPTNAFGTTSKDLKCVETVKSKNFAPNVNTHELLATQDRDSSLDGSPFRLTASCTVAGLPDGQSSELLMVLTRAHREGDPIKASLFSDQLNKEVNSSAYQYTFSFTKHDLSPTIPITNGQLLSFNVVISFS